MADVTVTKLQDNSKMSKRKVDYHITGESTGSAVKKVRELLPKIDRVTRVIHFRDSNAVEYVTYILGIRGAIRVEGGLTSGYGGEGVRGLLAVLESSGFDKKDVWDTISKKADDMAKIDFIK